jgi:hypothetical protein
MDRLGSKRGDFLSGNADLDASRLPRNATNETELFKDDDHSMDRRGRDSEVRLHVGFGWRPAVEQHVSVDEGEVLALLIREARLGMDGHGDVPRSMVPDHHERTVPHHVDVGGA